MAKMIKQKGSNDPEDLKQAIIKADVWLLVTATKDKKGQGAEIAVRESYTHGAINMIAMLLQQKEIYDAVQAKIAQVKLMDKEKGNDEPDLTVN